MKSKEQIEKKKLDFIKTVEKNYFHKDIQSLHEYLKAQAIIQILNWVIEEE